jgi:hypothetical protein
MKHGLGFTSLLLGVLFLALAPTALASSTWYVDGVNGSDSNDCKSPQTACKTIGHAISLASSGDSIMVAAETYTENLTIGISLKVIGSGPTTTIIDGGATNTVITLNSGQVTLSGLTIQNGYAQNGGGIYNNGTLTINHSTITQNHATKLGFFGGGGGIYNQGGLTINNSTVSGNSTALGRFRYGGGIWNGGILTIKNSTISGNESLNGGGIYNRSGLTISGSTISGNTAPSYYNSGDNAEGGGIYNAGTLTLNNSTLSGNSATSFGDVNCGLAYGGGIDGSATINNSTLSGNYARGCLGYGFGGGIYGSATLQNTIVANTNTPWGGNCDGTMTSKGYNLSSDGTCSFNGTGDLNNTNPDLGTLRNNGGPTQTQALLTGSPAIDAGNPKGCTDGNGHLLKTDQRGAPRHDKEDTGGCDMGAYERQKD